MDPVQALAILSLGAFVAILVSAIFYLFTVRPRLLEPVSLSSVGLLDEALHEELMQQRRAVEQLNSALTHHTQQLEVHAAGASPDIDMSALQDVLHSQSDTTTQLTALLTDQANKLAGLDQRLNRQESTLDQIASETLPEITAQLAHQKTVLTEINRRAPEKTDSEVAELIKTQADQLIAISGRLDQWVAVTKPNNEKLAEHARILAELDRELAAHAQVTQRLESKVGEHTTMLLTAANERREQSNVLQRILDQIGQAIPLLNRLLVSPPRPEHDRLTDIKGIGPVYAGKLYEAGIQTYRQLAAMTIEEVYTLIQEPAWRMRSIDAESWIKQAEHLASQREKVESLS